MKDIETQIQEARLQRLTADLVSAGLEIIDSERVDATVCPGCGILKPDVAKRRINTAYHDDESNWQVSCRECWKETIEHYRELWAEYRS